MSRPGPEPKVPITVLGSALARKRADRSQTAVAQEIGISRQTYRHAEAGSHVPSTKTAQALSSWLAWPVNRVVQSALQTIDSTEVHDFGDQSRTYEAPVVSVIRAAREFGVDPATISQLVMALDRAVGHRETITSLGKAILKRRKGVPLVEAAHMIGLSTERLHYIEQGLVKPDPSELRALAVWLDWEISDVESASR